MVLDKHPNGNIAIKVEHVKKKFRLYHEKHETLKETIIARKRASFTELWALDDVSYEFEQGRTYGIIGENASGKSTLLKMIARILRPDTGTVTVNGRISALLELGAGFHSDLTGRENIYLNGAIMRLSKAEIDTRFDDIVDFSEIGDFIDTPVKNYSSGMYMRLGFAIAVNVDADILLIDEVLAVGDESFQKKCIHRLEAIKASGKTIVFVSHDAESVRNLCDRAILLENGKVVAAGEADGVVDKYHAMLSSRETSVPRTDIGGPETGRYGTLEGRLEKCEITDGNGKPAKAFKFGEKMNVRLEGAFKTAVDEPIFGIIIANEDGTAAYSTNSSWQGINFGKIQPGRDVVLDIEMRANLGVGKYVVTSAISHSDASRFYDWWERSAGFVVAGDESGRGVADMAAKLTYRFKTRKSDTEE